MKEKSFMSNRVVLPCLVAGALLACTKDPPRDATVRPDPSATTAPVVSAPPAASIPAATSATASPAPSASSAAPAISGVKTATSGSRKGQNCATDGDCQTHASYCQDAPCACLVLGKGEAAPKCKGPSVNCLVNPCGNKQAKCAAGACVLDSGATK